MTSKKEKKKEKKDQDNKDGQRIYLQLNTRIRKQ